MNRFEITETKESDQKWIIQYITKHWGNEKVVVHNKIYVPHKLNGYIAKQDNNLIGLVTYFIENERIEIVSLNSDKENIGVGTALVQEVINLAKGKKLISVWLVTTNDNLNAITFYTKRGFRLTEVTLNAVEKSRKLKPEIPYIGDYGIQIKDELKFELIIK